MKKKKKKKKKKTKLLCVSHPEQRHGVQRLVSHTDHVSAHSSVDQSVVSQLHQCTVRLQSMHVQILSHML